MNASQSKKANHNQAKNGANLGANVFQKRVNLALGGGGAKGFVHVGVLTELAKQRDLAAALDQFILSFRGV